MSRFVVVTWDGAGNLVSTLAVAHALAERGHDVRLLGHRSIADRCGTDGWQFVPYTEALEFDSARPWDVGGEMATLAPQLWFDGGPGRDLRAELEREPADVLVVDCMLLGAVSAAVASGLPTVALFHSPISGFRGGPMVEMLMPYLPALNDDRVELGLAPVAAPAGVHDECAASLVFCPREYDVDLPLPDTVRYVGPVLDGPSLSARRDDVAIADGPDPLVLVSFSTSYQHQRDAIQRVIDALGKLPVRAVVTTGPSIAPEELSTPANATVVRFVPHDEVLARASLVVTHAGLGTVMNALRHGVPMVCAPMGRDQFFNAAMVERLGAGRSLPPEAPADVIRAQVEAVLHDADAKAAAKAMAGVIAGTRARDEAVDVLEGLAVH
jgi:MGT family glycosyltransferase